jgi:hypothetical protein
LLILDNLETLLEYERLNIRGLEGVTEAQREAMLAVGAVAESKA